MDQIALPRTSWVARFFAAPLELQAFAVFSVVVTALDWTSWIWEPTSVREAIVPITGWVPSLAYSFSIFFTFMFILMPVQNWRPLRFALVTFLLMYMGLGLYDLMVLGRGPNFDNPYLTVSPWQPLWTMVVPAVWIAVLYSPRVTRFCDGRVVRPAA